jgi:cobalt-precorrin 5A hydrolase
MPDLAIVALTPNGLALGRRLTQALGRGEVLSAQGSARTTLTEQFQANRPLVCIMALGIVVRILGSLVHDKAREPAVVVVDEAGRFAISVLGGHRAGANELAEEVAVALGAMPVITTASECLGVPAIDLIGRSLGWKIEDERHLTTVAAAVVRGEAIAVYQEAGRRDWWVEFGGWPTNFQSVMTYPQGRWGGVLIVTDHWHPPLEQLPYPVVVYCPPSLVLGVGCKRGVPYEEIEALFQYVCETRGFAPLSLGLVATVSLKADEPGLQEFAAQHRVPLRSFSVKELAQVADLPTPSETVRAKIGIAGVAEPAALLASGAKYLLMEKYRSERITMALARREDA